jgi:hypothetical protein
LSKNIKIKIHISIIFPAVLYGFESWSLTMWDEYGLRVFEKRSLRKRRRDKRGMEENTYRSADKPLARPGRKHATATEDFDSHISYL